MNRFSNDPEAAAVDVHQHLMPPPLIAALRRRDQPPCLRGWRLELAGEPPYQVDPPDHDVDRRAEQATTDGLQLALVSLSSALGVELLPPAEARALLDAYHEGAVSLPCPFAAWAATCMSDIHPMTLEQTLEHGFVGLQLPATELLDEDGYDRIGSLLALLEDRGRPLLIHPGPVASVPRGAPAWWPSVVSYVQQMHAAWFAFRVHGRARHPKLRVCFAMLAGLAPLHGERLAARAGERSAVDEDVYLDISSYGTRAVDATARVLGVDVFVNGSDRPYADPTAPDLGAAALLALRHANPFRLLDLEEVTDGLDVAAAAQSRAF